MNKPFSIPLRVYYEDTDAAGVVYYANYLRFIERCRSEWLVASGMPIDTIENTCGAIFVVRHVDAHYFLPARLMDQLTVTMEILVSKRVQFVAKQTVLRGTERIFEATVTLACLDRASFKPVALPSSLKKLLTV